MPEQGQYVVPYLETDDEFIKTEEVIESQEKYLAQQLRMIQLTEAKCHVVQRPLREIIEEIKEIKLDQFENDILQSSVP
ncbi:hypothetical protein, partial [Caldalkalibacillus salinus]|uniref:hypothetical protein n=1 Tax=Caldalkalibacillus salinus TaxID=2803787 RepID=UPI00192373E8